MSKTRVHTKMAFDSERLQKWALGAEITGGIAVVVSLVLVAYEIRQSTSQAALNTNALQISAYQDLISGISGINSLVAQDAELAEIVVAARNGREGLTDVEKQRYLRFAMSLFRHGDMAFFQFQRGMINEDRLNSALGVVLAELRNSEGARDVWNGSKDVFVPGYATHVDRRLAVRKQ